MNPTVHDRKEWAQIAAAAYAVGLMSVGHFYSGAAAWPENEPMDEERFMKLARGALEWSIFGTLVGARVAVGQR